MKTTKTKLDADVFAEAIGGGTGRFRLIGLGTDDTGHIVDVVTRDMEGGTVWLDKFDEGINVEEARQTAGMVGFEDYILALIWG